MKSAPVVLLFAISVGAFGQDISIGIVAGGSLTRDFRNETSLVPVLGDFPGNLYFHQYSTSKGYIVGGMVEVALPLHLFLEVDGLYRPLNFVSVASSVETGSAPSNTVVTWEFPVLAKYKFHVGAVKPFLELGPSLRTAGNLNDTSPSNHGITAGAGVELHLLKLKIAPAARYTHWAEDSPPSHVEPVARTNPNQAGLLAGFSF